MSNCATNLAYQKIHDMITSRELMPGEQLKETLLAAKLGVSRTPIREALRRLQQENIVEMIPNRGCFVKKLSYEELADGYEIIAHLGSMACQHLADTCESLSVEHVDSLNGHIKKMQEICSIPERKREWIEEDIAFHNLTIELCGKSQLQHLYAQLASYVNQVLMFITMMYVDVTVTTKEHEEILRLILSGSKNTGEYVLNHHMNTVNLLKRLQSMGIDPGV